MKKIIETIKQKWAEYLLEIIVITFGILLAFGLTNWNENRKEKVSEKILLRELSRNLKANVTSLEESIKADKFTQGLSEDIVHFLSNKKPFSDSLDFFSVAYRETINIVSSSFTTMKSVGLNIVKNDVLREKIINLYEVEYLILDEHTRFIQETEFQASLIPLWNKHFKLIAGKMEPNDYSELLNNHEILNIYSRILFWKSTSIQAKLNSIEDSKELISIIELELLKK